MAILRNELRARFTADSTDFNKVARDVSRTVRNLRRTIGTAVAGGGFGLIATGAIKAAAAAEEVEDRFRAVFAGIGDEANAVARKFATDFDLATSTAQEMLATTGDLLVGFGFARKEALALSGRVSKLGGDLASFTDVEGGTAFAVRALTRAMLGQTEQAQRLNVVFRQDTATFKARLKYFMEQEGLSLNQAKALTVLEIAQKQSTNAMDNYAITAGSTSNRLKALAQSQKELKEQTGKFLVKALEVPTILKAISDWMRRLGSSVDDNTDKWVSFVKGVAVRVTTFTGIVKELFGALGRNLGIIAFNAVEFWRTTFKWLVDNAKIAATNIALTLTGAISSTKKFLPFNRPDPLPLEGIPEKAIIKLELRKEQALEEIANEASLRRAAREKDDARAAAAAAIIDARRLVEAKEALDKRMFEERRKRRKKEFKFERQAAKQREKHADERIAHMLDPSANVVAGFFNLATDRGLRRDQRKAVETAETVSAAVDILSKGGRGKISLKTRRKLKELDKVRLEKVRAAAEAAEIEKAANKMAREDIGRIADAVETRLPKAEE